MAEFVREILRVVDAFQGGPDAPRNIAEFISLGQRLQLLFHHYSSVRKTHEGAESEKHLAEATKSCLACFIRHFDAEVLSGILATELQEDDFSNIVYPVYSVLVRLLATASEDAKLFNDKALKDEIDQSIVSTLGFVPLLDPGQHSVGSNVAADFLSWLESAHEASVDSGSSSGNSSSSSLSDEINTPLLARSSQDASSHSASDAPTTMAHGCRSLAEDMDIDDIISGGLGLSGGRHDRVRESGHGSTLVISDKAAFQTEHDQRTGNSQDDLGHSASVIIRHEPEIIVEKEKKARTPRKSARGRQRTVSTRSNPNKENLQHDP